MYTIRTYTHKVNFITSLLSQHSQKDLLYMQYTVDDLQYVHTDDMSPVCTYMCMGMMADKRRVW